MIRAFAAIPVPEDTGALLAPLQARLPSVRVVPRQALHVTLVFIGEHQEPVIEDLHYALEAIAAQPFALALSGLGMFGGASPRVLYAGVAPEPKLKALRDRVRSAGREAGIVLAQEKFLPHVTLARFPKTGLGAEDTARLDAAVASHAGLRLAPFAVEKFTLFRSHLGRSGPNYEPLADYPLAK
ncbi:MAG: RNA 2',3'-cyclic phosphodiesterase [Pseudomonadota bacterium]